MQAFLRPLTVQNRLPYICADCTKNLQVRFPSTIARRTAKAGDFYKYGAKLEGAEEEWQEKAAQVRNGQQESMLNILEGRGYVHKLTESATQSTHHGLKLMAAGIETSWMSL